MKIKKNNNIEYYKMAFVFVLSTLTTPLLSAVDTAIVGQLTNPVYIGGVTLGSTIFNTMYWILGFLRVSTSGYSAKAYGSKNKEQQILSLIRPMVIAIIIGILFLIFQDIILFSAKKFYNSTQEILEQMQIYYKILIWGAPFVLLNYTFLGWIMGRKNIRACILLQLVTNMINIILDVYFVKVLNTNVGGVAYATLISQILTTILSVFIIFKVESRDISIVKEFKKIEKSKIFNRSILKEILSVKLDLIIRTICLLTVINLFMEKSSQYGEIILASNSILFQIQYLMAYIFDGFSNAASIFIGNGIGEKNKEKIKWIIKKSFQVCIVLSLVISLSFSIFGKYLIKVFSNNVYVIDSALRYKMWLIIFPLVVNGGLVFYGLYTGATKTKYIKNSMILALVPFFLVYFFIIPIFHNDGLWLSFIIFSMGRTLFLYMFLPKLKKEIYKEIRLC